LVELRAAMPDEKVAAVEAGEEVALFAIDNKRVKRV
jgi:hypothetical protein